MKLWSLLLVVSSLVLLGWIGRLALFPAVPEWTRFAYDNAGRPALEWIEPETALREIAREKAAAVSQLACLRWSPLSRLEARDAKTIAEKLFPGAATTAVPGESRLWFVAFGIPGDEAAAKNKAAQARRIGIAQARIVETESGWIAAGPDRKEPAAAEADFAAARKSGSASARIASAVVDEWTLLVDRVDPAAESALAELATNVPGSRIEPCSRPPQPNAQTPQDRRSP